MFKILVITDGKLSSLNQCNSIVNELQSLKKVQIRYLKIKRGLIHFFPNSIIYLKLLINSFFDWKLNNKKINFIISCGRIAAPYNLIFKKKHNCKNCHILNPYFKKKAFDRIIIPEYDSLKFSTKENLILTKGTLVERKKINLNKNELKKISNLFKKKYKVLLVLIGGNGKSSTIDINDLELTIKNINKEKNIEIVYCFSRRTSDTLKNFINKNKNKKSFIFPNQSFNPYWELINVADYIFVTADSVSMISDALSTGKPTYIIPIKKLKLKIKKFHLNLNKQNITRIYYKKLQSWKYEKFEESKRVVKELKNFLNF
ncbi:MAG: hypothetical protein CL572_05030 [Alphaproteobacteria bacterium]|nr:hypothetical protein [Alphaproteobacteria bacterium]